MRGPLFGDRRPPSKRLSNSGRERRKTSRVGAGGRASLQPESGTAIARNSGAAGHRRPTARMYEAFHLVSPKLQVPLSFGRSQEEVPDRKTDQARFPCSGTAWKRPLADLMYTPDRPRSEGNQEPGQPSIFRPFEGWTGGQSLGQEDSWRKGWLRIHRPLSAPGKRRRFTDFLWTLYAKFTFFRFQSRSGGEPGWSTRKTEGAMVPNAATTVLMVSNGGLHALSGCSAP
jgi:hypothetical protein